MFYHYSFIMKRNYHAIANLEFHPLAMQVSCRPDKSSRDPAYAEPGTLPEHSMDKELAIQRASLRP